MGFDFRGVDVLAPFVRCKIMVPFIILIESSLQMKLIYVSLRIFIHGMMTRFNGVWTLGSMLDFLDSVSFSNNFVKVVCSI